MADHVIAMYCHTIVPKISPITIAIVLSSLQYLPPYIEGYCNRLQLQSIATQLCYHLPPTTYHHCYF